MCVRLELERNSTAVRIECVRDFTVVPSKLSQQQVLPNLLVQKQSQTRGYPSCA